MHAWIQFQPKHQRVMRDNRNAASSLWPPHVGSPPVEVAFHFPRTSVIVRTNEIHSSEGNTMCSDIHRKQKQQYEWQPKKLSKNSDKKSKIYKSWISRIFTQLQKKYNILRRNTARNLLENDTHNKYHWNTEDWDYGVHQSPHSVPDESNNLLWYLYMKKMWKRCINYKEKTDFNSVQDDTPYNRLCEISRNTTYN